LPALVAGLALLVAVGAAMPAYARLLGGPHAHACSCEVRRGHAQCACPLCFPELADVDTFGAPSLTGRCGTDDPGWRTLSAPAVTAADFVLVAPLAHALLPMTPPISPTQWSERPELPPPRA
jgi:hypothetical protein